MRYNKQRFRHNPSEGIYGDCHRTAIACLLDKEPEEVPHFGVHYGNSEAFHNATNEYLKTQGLRVVDIIFNADLDIVLSCFGQMNKGLRYLLAGTSKNNVNHTVVCLSDKIEWDPSLDDSGIVGPCDDGFYWITTFSPIALGEQ